MAQSIQGTIIFKSYTEYDIQNMYGNPYILIIKNSSVEMVRLYLLDTKDALYYPVSEWHMNDKNAFNKWYEYSLELQQKIADSKLALKEKIPGAPADMIDQFVPEEQRIIKETVNDTWNYTGSHIVDTD